MQNNLKVIMESKGISQKDLAQITGVSASTICSILSGKRFFGAKSIKKIAETLGISEFDLVNPNFDPSSIKIDYFENQKNEINKDERGELGESDLDDVYFRDTMKILKELCKGRYLNSKQRIALASEIYKKVEECRKAGENEKKEIISHAKIEILVNEGLVKFFSGKESLNLLKTNISLANETNKTETGKKDNSEDDLRKSGATSSSRA